MKIKDINEAEFNEVIAADTLTVVDFWAAWCGPCMMLGPVMEEVAGELADVAFYKVNVDDHQELAIKFGIDAIPCVIFFKNGAAVGRSVGLVDKAAMIARINEVK